MHVLTHAIMPACLLVLAGQHQLSTDQGADLPLATQAEREGGGSPGELAGNWARRLAEWSPAGLVDIENQAWHTPRSRPAATAGALQ